MIRTSIFLIALLALGGFTKAFVITNNMPGCCHHQKASTYCVKFFATRPSTSQAMVTPTPVPETTTIQFVSPNMQVYIEDTDAYGVKYNANYLRTYDRALHQACTSLSETDTFPSMADDDDDWSIISVEQIKLKQPPTLGEEYVIRGQLIDDEESQQGSPSTSRHTWDMSMTSPDGTIVYSTATNVTIQPVITTSLPSRNHWVLPDNSITSKDVFPIFRDEFDSHLPRTHLPLFVVLKFMERARSNWIGGPSALHRLQHDDNIVYVVTSFDQLQLVEGSEYMLRPGDDTVTIQTQVCPRRNGAMVLDCYQTALVKGEHVIAQGKVTIMALNRETWRPTKKLPDWFLQKFEASD